MIDTIAAFDGRIAKIQGAAQTGKTEALVARVAAILANDADATVLVELSCAQAIEVFAERLGAVVPHGTSTANVTLACALDICARVLSTEDAQSATGRVARILNEAEYKFLLEDMKTLGLPARQLRNMLNHFYASMSSLKLSDVVIEGSDEAAVYEHLLSHLKTRRAMLAQEAASVCVDYLKSATTGAQEAKYDYVLCDDFQNLSYAEQTCMGLLATKQFIVAGNENQTYTGWYATPFVEGFKDFENRRKNVEVFTLDACHADANVVAFANALVSHGSMNPVITSTPTQTGAKNSVEVIKWNKPEEEFDGITKIIRVDFDTHPDKLESHTCILVPNKQWARAAKKVLCQRGFEVSDALCSRGVGGDPRESAKCRGLVAYTKLCLLADSTDVVAWRSWCGFDNYLCNSDAWSFLLAYAKENGLDVLEALTSLENMPANAMPFLRAEVFKQKMSTGKAFIEKNKKRKGFDLLASIGADKLAEFAPILDAIDGDETALELLARVREYFFSPSFPTNKRTLHIATPEMLCGSVYDEIYVLGAVNGYYPVRDAFEVVSTDEARSKVKDECRRAFYSAVAKAKKRLVISYFAKADLELAERTKMQVVRVRAEGSERIALASPSIFLDEAGDAAPGAVAGQAKLVELNLI